MLFINLISNIKIIIQIAVLLLFFKQINQANGYDCTPVITSQNFNASQIICALAQTNNYDINQVSPNLVFPSPSCYNIKNVAMGGNNFYGIGGDSCDYTQPIVYRYNSSPYYAQRVFIFPVQWVFQSNCPMINASISVNKQLQKYTQITPSQYFASFNLCDYYSGGIFFDNLNELVTQISYYPGQYTKYIESLYILIFKCPLGCSSCDNSLLNCLSCTDGYYLLGSSCQEKDETMKSISQVSQIAFTSAMSLSFLQSAVSSSSFGILMSGFIVQKFSYFLLVDTILPINIYQFLQALSKQYPTQQLTFLNAFKNLISSDNQNYQSDRYQLVNISFNILQTSGQYALVFSVCLFCFLALCLIFQYTHNVKFISFFGKLYDIIISGLIIQYSQLCVMIFSIGINQQIKEFAKNSEIQLLGLKISFTLLLLTSILCIFYALHKYINYEKAQFDDNNNNFSQINKQKILNDIILESKIRRYFVLINLVFEALLIPTIFIQFSSIWQVCTSLSLTVQFSLLVITIYLRPFASKLNNIFFIINSLLWLILYIIFLLINIIIQQTLSKNHEVFLDVSSLIFLVILFIIILLPVFLMLIQLIMQLIQFINQKRKEKNNKKEQSQNSIILNQSSNTQIKNNTQQSLNIYEKKKSMSSYFDQLTSKRSWFNRSKKKQKIKNGFSKTKNCIQNE
ncbi:transmembrane protein, putative (macronuclear) [Tetrahymena thermophila SB210]|uniref:Transmembrane protein, putative n=1 Tax=Tetrahymena thermophila (strain SB210) TaxID=312017 RepID=W7X867_TETTS|nr:transmembrane protein, putative [Tetrahymena thermophila SB210]EWS75570.1 transmembrane protein, putative [Tetrahymena thermophila SB210]|eukprot:XP_012651870.1 transmembrane protein, putative [Tetrahymena thermophila SB210]